MLERINFYLELVVTLLRVCQIVWQLFRSWREFRNGYGGTPQSSEDQYDLQLIDAMLSNEGERASHINVPDITDDE